MPDRDHIHACLRKHLVTTYPHEGAELLDTTDLFQEWFVDSMGVLLLVTFLEETFDVTVRRGDIVEENFRSIESIANYVIRRGPGAGCS